MDWIEFIRLRSHSQRDREKVLAGLREASFATEADGLKQISVFANHTVAYDLGVFICWHDTMPTGGKSRVGIRLASALSEFGQIHHSVWNHEICLFTLARKHPAESRRLPRSGSI
ncbi:MAG: hypothetical protein PVG49_07415 [Desulfobacteraceae bacterium]|jgi:hypothetical protein